MFCTKCGSKLKEGSKFCQECGSPAKLSESPNNINAQEPISTHSPTPPKKSSKKNNNFLAIFLGTFAGLLILLFAFIAYILVSNNNKPMPNIEGNNLNESSSDSIVEEEEKTENKAEDNLDMEVKNSDLPPVDVNLNNVNLNNEDILPHSSSSYLDHSDIVNLNDWQLRIARNEIYARHGRMFRSEDLQDYFNNQPWYNPRIPADEFKESSLSALEKHNVELIQSYE